MWWQALVVLMQGASAGVPFWALLWAVDRLRGGDGTAIDPEALEAAWRDRYGADAGPATVSETPIERLRDFVAERGDNMTVEDFNEARRMKADIVDAFGRIKDAEPERSRGVLRVGGLSFAVLGYSMEMRGPLIWSGPPPDVDGTVEVGIPDADAISALRDAMASGTRADLTLPAGPSGTSFCVMIRSLDFSVPAMQCEVGFASCGPIVAGGITPPMGVLR